MSGRRTRNTLLIGLIATGLILVVVIGGALMPRNHRAVTTVVIAQPADSIWPVLRDFERLPVWWEDVDSVERAPAEDGVERWVEHMSTGPIALAVVDERPNARLVTRIDVGESAAFGGSWTYTLEPTDSGTRVTIVEDGYVNNLIFRFFMNTVFDPHDTAVSYLKSLGLRFGETVTPEFGT